MSAAAKSDWKTLALPENRTTIELSRRFTPDEMAQIRLGVIPEEMEDKWFVYWEDASLCFHRSWTGICLYVVRFSCDENGAVMVSADVNRDPDEYTNADDLHDAQMIPYLIDVLLLRRPASFPARSSTRGEAALEQWSLVGQAGLGIHPGDGHEPRLMIRTKCPLCAHKFLNHQGCLAFPVRLPDELAIGNLMHDHPYPGDRGYLFEERKSDERLLLDHLYKGKRVEIPIDRLEVDALACDFAKDSSTNASYREFVEYFRNTSQITTRELIIGASLTYSWMPTVLEFKKPYEQESVAAYLDAVRLGNVLDGGALSLVKAVVNNSMIGASKLLHFVNPELYPIIDSRVDTYLYGSSLYERQNSVEHYLAYTCGCRRAVKDPRFVAIHERVESVLEYTVTPLRALDLVMFLSAKARAS